MASLLLHGDRPPGRKRKEWRLMYRYPSGRTTTLSKHWTKVEAREAKADQDAMPHQRGDLVYVERIPEKEAQP